MPQFRHDVMVMIPERRNDDIENVRRVVNGGGGQSHSREESLANLSFS